MTTNEDRHVKGLWAWVVPVLSHLKKPGPHSLSGVSLILFVILALCRVNSWILIFMAIVASALIVYSLIHWTFSEGVLNIFQSYVKIRKELSDLESISEHNEFVESIRIESLERKTGELQNEVKDIKTLLGEFTHTSENQNSTDA